MEKKPYLKIILFILIILKSCSILKKSNNYNLFFRSDDFVVLSLEEKDFSPTLRKRMDKKIIKDFLNSIYYFKNGNKYSDKNYIFNSKISSDLLEIIYSQENSNSFYIIFKREDPIAPYSRLYRTIFSITFFENFVQFEFQEIDKNFIFGNQYNYSDWAIPRESIECNNRNNLYYPEEYKNILNSKSEECRSNELNKFFVYSSSQETKIVPIKNEVRVIDRLKELEELKKNKLISEKEYLEIRNKILNNL